MDLKELKLNDTLLGHNPKEGTFSFLTHFSTHFSN